MKGNISQSQGALEVKNAESIRELERKTAEDIAEIEREISEEEQEVEQELKGKVDISRKINGQTLENDVNIANVESADKLKIPHTIGAKGAVTSTPTAFDGTGDILIPIDSIKEAYINWGGKNRTRYISPVDAAMLPELNANRLAFIKDSAVKFELSADAGATWTDVSDQFDGTSLCTTSIAFGNGNTATDQSTARQHRITIDCIGGGLYCQLAKIMVLVSTEGATDCTCKVEFGEKSENTVWTTFVTANVDGWQGWNVINVDHLVGMESVSWGPSYRYVRLTFSVAGVASGRSSDLSIKSIRFISSMFNNATSVLASRGTVYSIDRDQNVTFPKNVIIQGNTLQIGNTTITETQLKSLLALLT